MYLCIIYFIFRHTQAQIDLQSSLSVLSQTHTNWLQFSKVKKLHHNWQHCSTMYIGTLQVKEEYIKDMSDNGFPLEKTMQITRLSMNIL